MATKTIESRRWMQGASSPLRGALLGLVLEQPGHGGELASRLARRLGHPWRIDPTDIYRLLARLEDEGLLCSSEEPTPGSQRATRVVYHVTEETSEALTLWLETLVPREPMRSTLHAKLAAAQGVNDARLLLRALEAHERECLELAQLVPPMTSGAASLRTLLLDCVRSGVWTQLQAEIDWSRQSRERISEYLNAT